MVAFVIVGMAVAAAVSTAVKLDVEVTATMAYSVSLDGQQWLASSPVRAYFDHTEQVTTLFVCTENLIQTWFNSGSGMEAGVSQLRHVGLASIVRRRD
jgi:hypothetical protein